MDYLEKYKQWTTDEYFDEATRKELLDLSGNDGEIKDRFYKDLEFGTGGLRGVLGAGSNRMNLYTVRRATQGLANYIIKQDGADKGVAIAYDSRRMSPEFADEAALCLNANGIKAYVFESLRPTPELSFALRELGCISGIVITASHNPAEYNGYKVYWDDGAQITAPKDVEIIGEVNAIADYAAVKTMDKEAAKAKGLYHVLGKEMDDRYVAELRKLVVNPIADSCKDMKIVYTPLNGTGNLPVRRILKELGFTNVYVVPEQEMPDSNFTTVGYPNPEDPKVFTLARKLADEVGADLILATDPDADRLGVQVRNEKGEFVLLTGNMSGSLIAEYVFSQKAEHKVLPGNAALVKTIVTGNMADQIAKHYNAKLIEVLTGFKYIGEQIKLFEETGCNEYVFGFEESYGCLIGTHARDKDAVVAVMTLCEAAAYYKNQGVTLYEQMNRLFEKYGYFKEDLVSVTLKGIEGMEKIKEIMESYRQNPPKAAGGYQVLKFRDYKKNTMKDFQTKEVTPTGLPTSDVLYFELEEDAWCAVRPSGTEPKIKFYFGVKGEDLTDAEEKLKKLVEDSVFQVS
ncbi:phosphoglucomutase [Anaerocolumna cellulosilytica]|uniref:Phosphoglucomutase n=1 Tax=Anaerocolumna cellulosilytica TaxID=433286 RepID=A0A6S6QQ96_9FIRM|nr:phospho-sugar mutase [Anaerocolumna cellulosilytica]MBB5197322.1 phosphoglucomutase [Anaerocolumna cellulosilytica]BCJ92764.1 phosphoglucomutase [Anaerocolumna cellulosilytica]